MAGTDPTLQTDDLAPLLGIVGDATDVGLGESVHTSGGFEAMKARLVRYLVEEAGFRVVAMETNRTRAMDIAGSYVRTCQGDATQAVTAGIFGVFACDTTATLLAWMCEYSRAHPSDPLQFVGFDIQQPVDDYIQLTQYLAKAAPAACGTLIAGLAMCDQQDPPSLTTPYPEASYDACTQGLDALDAYLTQNRESLTAESTSQAYSLAHVASVSFRAWQGDHYYFGSNPRQAEQIRDAAMATVYETLRAIYFPQAKAILWAHDGHLMRDGAAAGYVPNMGSILTRDLGDAYLPIGLSGWSVSVNWPGELVGQTPLPGASAEVFEWKLEQLGRPWLLVDLDDLGLASFIRPGATYGYGNSTTAPVSMQLVPAAQFRAAIFFETSPPMNALDWAN